MNIDSTIKIINKKYKTSKVTLDMFSIDVDYLYDSFNFFSIYLLEKDNELFLSDLGNSHEILSLNEYDIKIICDEFNLNFENYHIICKFNNITDVDNFINCLIKISQNHL